ncbi:MAG: hypothetical protein GX111_13320 [Clostridiales bacterium]|nr:hypothetical protein [Clostridiales bacterium]
MIRLFIERNRRQIRDHKVLFVIYLVIRLMVIAVMITELLSQSYYNVFFCILTLVLLMIPSFVEKRIKIDVPDVLEIIILLFIFAAQILGELQEYYLTFRYWDTMLHVVNGFLCAAIGLALIDILNNSPRFSISLSPVYVALTAFAFSMTVGVIWEFFEFGMDQIFHTDMQKDTIIQSISSVVLNPEGRNVAVTLHIDNIVVNGETWNYGGYIDIGLIDTMTDLLVNFIGAVVFSVIGYFYIKSKGRGRLVKQFILTKMNDVAHAKK